MCPSRVVWRPCVSVHCRPLTSRRFSKYIHGDTRDGRCGLSPLIKWGEASLGGSGSQELEQPMLCRGLPPAFCGCPLGKVVGDSCIQCQTFNFMSWSSMHKGDSVFCWRRQSRRLYFPWQMDWRPPLSQAGGPWASQWQMWTFTSALRSIGWGGNCQGAFQWPFVSVLFFSKRTALKKILNPFTSRIDLENWIEFECLVIITLKIKKGVLEAKCLGMDLADVLPEKHLRKLLGLRDDILVHLFGCSCCREGRMLF